MTIRDAGHDAGHDADHDAGNDAGHGASHDAGRRAARNAGQEAGKATGHARFGTDGWRGILACDFTFAAAARVACGLASLAHERGGSGQGAVVGYDRRFLSEAFAQCCAGELSACGMEVLLCSDACPTPAVSFAVRDLGAAYGLVVTASHNPPEYNGIKLRGPDGAPLSLQDQRWIEAWLDAGHHSLRNRAGHIHSHDPWPGYRDGLQKLLDLDLIRRTGIRVLHDSMHGSAAGWIKRFLPSARQLRIRRDPLFGGAGPEPLPERLGELMRLVRGAGCPTVGLATDGDGDRLAAVSEDGEYVDSHHLLALLFMHLVERRGAAGGVVRTVTTSSMVDVLAARYGLPVEVTPVGFVHIAERFARAGRPGLPFIIGGEESGGIGVPAHMPERDGVFAGLLLLEHLAVSGCTLARAVDLLRSRVGRRHLGRLDVPLSSEAAAGSQLSRLAVDSLAGVGVSSVELLDGVTLKLADGCRLHVRASRTEPVVRLYGEAPDPARLRSLLTAGKTLLTPGSA
jgi:phosphomannomutase